MPRLGFLCRIDIFMSTKPWIDSHGLCLYYGEDWININLVTGRFGAIKCYIKNQGQP